MGGRNVRIVAALVVVLTASTLPLVAAESDWPRWNGPNLDRTSLGNGVFERASFGLEEAWSRPFGPAYSGISVVDGKLVTGRSDGRADLLVALDAATGEELWRYRISDVYRGHDGSDDGPIATPTVDDGTVYGLGAWGHLFAVRLADGTELWSRLLGEDEARRPSYGFASVPTVAGGVLVVQTGGPDGKSISGFDRQTGELLWTAGDDVVSYQSPTLVSIDGRRQLVAVTNHRLTGLDPATGEILWSHEHSPEGEGGFGVAQAVPIAADRILINDWSEAAVFAIRSAAGAFSVEEVWRKNTFRNSYGIPAPYDGYLFGFAGRFLVCADATTGEAVWKSRQPGGTNLVVVDGQLVIQTQDGAVVVAEASPEGYRERARVKVLDQGYLTAPSFAAGRIYVRNLDRIAAVRVADRVGDRAADRTADRTSAGARAEQPPELLGMLGAFVRKVGAAEDKTALVDEFLESHPQLPILEAGSDGGDLVHFLYRGEVGDLALAGNMMTDEAEPMHRIAGTDLFFRSMLLPSDSLFTYYFQIFDETVPDPRNPNRTTAEWNERSLLTTSGWKRPTHLAAPEERRGRMEKLTWKSELLGNERDIDIYLPAGYDDGDDRYPVLIVHHGDRMLEKTGFANSLENLLGKTVEPLVVAFVPQLGWPELAGSQSPQYTRALARELVPRIDATFRTRREAKARGVLGPGSAAVVGLLAVFQERDTFSKAAAQSFYPSDVHEELKELIRSTEKLDATLYLEWTRNEYKSPNGSRDGGDEVREIVALLEKKGYRPHTLEVSDGLGWDSWTGRADRVLETLFPISD